MPLNNSTSTNTSYSNVDKFLRSSLDNNHPLKLSLLHASGKDLHLKNQFNLNPYEIFLYKNHDFKSESSDSSMEFFVNCDSQVRNIDLLHSNVYPDLKNCVLMLVATNSTSHYFIEDPEYYTFVHLYSLSFDSSIATSIDFVTDLRLICLVPLKDDHCIQLRWVKINYETGFLFAFLLFKSGSVKLCRLSVDTLKKFLKTESKKFLNDRLVEVEYLWEFSPNLSSDKRLNCFDISYNVKKAFITLACGTNDGFLEIWDFNLNVFQSNFVVGDVENEFVESHRTIPVLCGINNSPLYREITDLSFLRFPNSYLLAIGTFSKGIILWDSRYGHSEGEVKTYHNIIKPINCVSWSLNNQYLLGCTSTGLFIDWQNRQTAVTVSSEKLTKQKPSTPFENICWSVDSSDDSLFFVFDSGENIQLFTSKLGKKSSEDDYVIYKWKLSNEGSEDNYEIHQSSDSLVDSVNYSIKKKFHYDLSKAKTNGVSIIRSSNDYKGSTENGNTPKNQVRNKVFALNTVRFLSTNVVDKKIKLMAYGGNLGLIHLVLNVF